MIKPIEIDANLKYRCPKCGLDHWIFLREAKTKNFKIVCDCNTILRPKQVLKIKILHDKKSKIETHDAIIPKKQHKEKEIPQNILKQTVQNLVGFGFVADEAEQIVREYYRSNPTNNVANLVKGCLSNIGVNNG